MRFLLYGVGAYIVFTVFVTVFAISAESRDVRALPKWLWVMLCVLVPFVGGALYLILGRPLPGQTGKKNTIAPDDDPEFLRKLREELDGENDAE
jgi:hypothetical protein